MPGSSSKGGCAKLLLAASFLSLGLFSACSPLYILQAAYEEGKILWRREPIDKALQKSDLDSGTREKFQLVLAVRDYARDSLGLKVDRSYTTYSYVDRPVLTYVVTAAPKTDFTPYTWWFLFVGRVPYKGFFSEEEAAAEARSLQSRGYDTFVRPSPAFSTLGWFNDPLLAHLLRYDKVTLAEIVFHELLHTTLFVKGAVDFNESLANFVGNRAAILFFRERQGEKSPEHLAAARAWEEELEFSSFIVDVAASLKELYAKELPEEEKLRLREGIFSGSREDWSRRIAGRPGHRFRGFSRQEINNAVIAHYLLYMNRLSLFEAFYEAQEKDLARSIQVIAEAVKKDDDDPFGAVQAVVGSRPPR